MIEHLKVTFIILTDSLHAKHQTRQILPFVPAALYPCIYITSSVMPVIIINCFQLSNNPQDVSRIPMFLAAILDVFSRCHHGGGDGISAYTLYNKPTTEVMVS